MKKSRLFLSVVVLTAVVCSAVYINFIRFDCWPSLAGWTDTALSELISCMTLTRAVIASPLPVQANDANTVPEQSVKPQDEPNNRAADSNAPAQPPADVNNTAKAADANEPQRITEANEPGRITETNEQQRNNVQQPGASNVPVDPNSIMEVVNLKDVQMRDIITKLADWTGKVIIPTDDAMSQKVTIYSSKKLPRRQALALIYSALRTKGYVAEEADNIIYLKPIKDAMFGSVPVVPADKPLAAIENKSQVVQKYFKIVNYSPSNLSNILLPMIGEHGYISADEDSKSLLVIDTVENLIRFERIISQFDVPEAGQAATEIFKIHNGDPAEIVQILNMLLGTSETSASSSGRQQQGFRFGPFRQPQSTPQQTSGSGKAASVVISSASASVVLIPEQKQRWIIAKGPPDTLKRIGEWIDKIDTKELLPSASYEIISVKYLDVTEAGDRINTALQKLPGSDLKTSVLVQPLPKARQIMVFGSPDMRDMVRKLVDEIDVVPTSEMESRTFKLKYADPEQIKTNIESLYSSAALSMSSYDSYYSSRYGRSGSTTGTGDVKVIAFPTMQEITVIASPQNLAKIEEQIKEWDVPVDVEALKPHIVELRNTDPVQMVQLLSKLFSESVSGQPSYYDYIFGNSSSTTKQQKKIVGALYGQLTFEAVPDTKKIIIISKIAEAYRVIEELIKELDREEMAEVPDVVILKYADAEELAIRLNAIFNEPGVVAPIWFRKTGLSQYSMEDQSTSTSTSSTSSSASPGASSNQTQQQRFGNTQGDYTPPWSRARQDDTKMSISNVIGRIRFIPDPRSKALLVLSPPEFKSNIIEMISKLDQPEKQVMVKAVIIEVDHDNLTSLGLQLASNPASFGTLKEDSITALTNLSFLENFGALKLDVTSSGGSGAANASSGLKTTSAVNTMIDFLVKKVDAKVLNQQTLWTKDNEEAEFFKGDNVAFQTASTVSGTGGLVTQSYEFKRVGMTLRARPNITPEKNVDMILNLILSQLTEDTQNGQPVRNEMETQTNLIVEDGQTIMLGGILFQKASLVERKLPLLGDLPAIGGLFRHNVTITNNDELIVFITPYVMDAQTSQRAKNELQEAQKKLKDMLKSLNESIGKSQ